MDGVSYPRAALLGFVVGSSVAIGWMTAFAVRTIASITRQHHWYQVKILRGK